MNSKHSLFSTWMGTFRILLTTDIHAIVPGMDDDPLPPFSFSIFPSRRNTACSNR